MRTKRLLCLAATVALLALTAHTAPKNCTPKSTFTFDDLAGDAIQSDLLGSYEATLEGEYLALSTGKKRSFHLDFSDCASGPCDGPFRDTLADSVSVTVGLYLWNRAGWIEFNANGKKWELWFRDLHVTPTYDASGQVDGYVIEDPGEEPAQLYEVAAGAYRRLIPLPIDRGRYYMPWGATVRLP
ncbi:MAG: hypothetical protein ACYTGZ_04120 [Planctomycetota bacterium]|jgi:hypothetical protein